MVPEPSGRVHIPDTSFWALWEGMGRMLALGMSSITSTESTRMPSWVPL